MLMEAQRNPFGDFWQSFFIVFGFAGNIFAGVHASPGASLPTVRDFDHDNVVGEYRRVTERYSTYGDSDQRSTFACYSCMSLSYQENWPVLSNIYSMPHSFTNRCNEPFFPKGIGTINCSTICVTLKESNVQGGVFLGYNIIRGCLNKMLQNGFNMTAVHAHRFRDFDICRSLPRAQLFRTSSADTQTKFLGDVMMCACMGDRCNDGGRARHPTAPFGVMSTLAVATFVLVWSRTTSPFDYPLGISHFR